MTNQVSKHTGDLGVSNGQVVTGQAILTGVSITVAAADVSVILYDNTSAAAPIAFQYDLDFNDTTMDHSKYIKIPDVKFRAGIWGVVTGTGAVVVLHYR